MSTQDTILKNRDIFLKYNEAKYQRLQQLISNVNIKRVINAIPILLCVNDKKLPGYVEGDCPRGIANFKADDDARKYLMARFHLKSLDTAAPKPVIDMFAVMGSVGTIAYTKVSDFDFWVCVDRRNFTDEMMALFQRKIEMIPQWVKSETDVESHLFINDIPSIKKNIFAEDEEEAFGSTIGATLKDEFFRSSIIIGGKIPFWWVIPRAVTDIEYEQLWRQVDDPTREQAFVDLGNLFEISKEDFLGAALFQLIKSLGNPFKSIIKIGVLEKYLFGDQRAPLISQKVKSHVLRGDLDNKIIDSYIHMFEEVYGYYESVLTDKSLLKMLRQNLYLKINPQLSKYSGMKITQNLPYKVLMMFKYMKEWGWLGGEIKELDDFENWDYNKTMTFWNMVRKFMLLSYQKISTQLPALDLKDKISDSDFKLLSRKIKTHFISEANKIDQYVTFKDTPYESILYIEPTNKSIDDHEWSLAKRNTSAQDKFVSTVIRTEKSLVKLIAWTAVNQIYNPAFSRIKLQSGYARINQNYAVELLNTISNLFLGNAIRLKNEYFLKPAFTVINLVVVNFAVENADSIRSVHHVYSTSWGESYIDEFKSENDLIRILGIVLKDSLMMRRSFDTCCAIITPEPFKKPYKDIESLFKEAYDFIVMNTAKQSVQMVAELAGEFVAVCREGSTVSIYHDVSIMKMLTKLSLRPKMDMINRFFGAGSRLQVLNEIYNLRKPTTMVMTYEEQGDHVIIYLVNERGNLFTFLKLKKYKEEAIVFLYDFCRNVINRINKFETLPVIGGKIQVYKISYDRFGKHSFENETHWVEGIYLAKYKGRKSIIVGVKRVEGADALYNISLTDNRSSDFIPLTKVPERVRVFSAQDPTLVAGLSDVIFLNQPKADIAQGSTPYCFERVRLEFILGRAPAAG